MYLRHHQVDHKAFRQNRSLIKANMRYFELRTGLQIYEEWDGQDERWYYYYFDHSNNQVFLEPSDLLDKTIVENEAAFYLGLNDNIREG